jgi:multicomponent Na+:H+ antiporter subunit C
MITAIVIGLSVTAVKVVMLITMQRKYGTTDWNIARAKSLE